MLLREAEKTDAAAIARVHVRSWQTTYADLVPPDYLTGLSSTQREAAWHQRLSIPGELEFVYVAEDINGNVVGFAWGGPERSGNDPYQGELFAIYLLLEYQRQGIGRQLVHYIARRFDQLGIQSMLVWVLADNPSSRFYERLGGLPERTDQINIGGASLTQVAYAWPDISELIRRSA